MAASLISEPHNPRISAQQPWVDTQLSLHDSDIEFKSSDGFIFQLHRSVLINAGGFPGSDIDTGGEIVPLTEPANVLEILFAFIYPKPQPELYGMQFGLLLAVAEAAAKYDVFSAVNSCNERLGDFIPKYPSEILDHAIKHDYRRLLSKTLPHFALAPLLPTVERLRPQYIIPFTRYHDAWQNIFKELVKVALAYSLETRSTYAPSCHESSTICTSCTGGLLVAIAHLESITNLENLRSTLHSPAGDPKLSKTPWCCEKNLGSNRGTHCPYAKNTFKLCQERIDKLPSFASFLGLKE